MWYISALLVFGVVSVCSISYSKVEDEPMVLTPGGMRPARCVREVPSDTIISKEDDFIRITRRDGDEELLEYCNFAKNTSNTSKTKRLGDTGWIAFAFIYATGPFSYFYGTWDVPSNPQNENDQTVFFFTGLEDATNKDIIQPVLQWGPSAAGGGDYWGVASWYVNSNGNALVSRLLSVNNGVTITGNMTLAADGTWWVVTTFPGYYTQIFLNNLDTLSFASTTLEAYNIANCEDYPSDGSITFNDMSLKNGNAPYYPAWGNWLHFTDCNQKVNVVGSATTQIYY